MSKRRQHRRITGPADLDITAFMNLMIVLVPVLLMNMVFAQTSILELNFPTGESAGVVSEDLRLQVVIQPAELVVADNKGGVIKRIPHKDGAHDFAQLQAVMKEVKGRVPETRAITLLPVADTSYQTLVTTMDRVRSYQTVVAGSLVHAELFPDISIADAPADVAAAVGSAGKEGT